MKKLLVLLIIICLCGCQESSNKGEVSFSNLGYSEDEIELLMTLPGDAVNELLKGGYNKELIELIKHPNFKQTKYYDYIELLDDYGADRAVKMVNSYLDIDKLKQLYANDYFIKKNEDLYLEYLSRYDNVRDCIEAINTKTYLDYYTNITDTDISKNYLMLINKYNKLSSDYEPDDLVDIDSYYGRGQTRAEVYEKYKQLADDAFAKGYSFSICSAYRAYDYQDGLYAKYLAQENGDQAKVDTYSARPGHSEHQSGLCLDLYDAVYGMDDFGLSDASKWINENCYKYGFIIRYTEEKEKITGYQAEPWQIRYVGDVDIAKDIMDRNITFDEYYACFIEE